MIVMFGHRLFGKVDVVPGLGHVATKFFHIDYLPLVPTETWLVMARQGKRWQGVRVPLSAKSIFVAWGRATALATAVVAGGIAVVFAVDRHPEPATAAVGGVVAVAAVAFIVLTHRLAWFRRASYARACQLAKLAQMNDRGLAALAAAYGQPVPTFGFQPVVPPVPRDEPAAVESTEDEPASRKAPSAPSVPRRRVPAGPPPMPPPKPAANPLRGY